MTSTTTNKPYSLFLSYTQPLDRPEPRWLTNLIPFGDNGEYCALANIKAKEFLDRKHDAARMSARNRVGCHVCRAKVGEYCRGQKNQVRLSLHKERWAAAIHLPSKNDFKVQADRRLIAEMVQAGRITYCPPARAAINDLGSDHSVDAESSNGH